MALAMQAFEHQILEDQQGSNGHMRHDDDQSITS